MRLKKAWITLVPMVIAFQLSASAEDLLIGVSSNFSDSIETETDWHNDIVEDQSFEVDLSEFEQDVWFVSSL